MSVSGTIFSPSNVRMFSSVNPVLKSNMNSSQEWSARSNTSQLLTSIYVLCDGQWQNDDVYCTHTTFYYNIPFSSPQAYPSVYFCSANRWTASSILFGSFQLTSATHYQPQHSRQNFDGKTYLVPYSDFFVSDTLPEPRWSTPPWKHIHLPSAYVPPVWPVCFDVQSHRLHPPLRLTSERPGLS
jgi:hypothetical protein